VFVFGQVPVESLMFDSQRLGKAIFIGARAFAADGGGFLSMTTSKNIEQSPQTTLKKFNCRVMRGFPDRLGYITQREFVRSGLRSVFDYLFTGIRIAKQQTRKTLSGTEVLRQGISVDLR
jgi:hypothetical protein